jgi:hypothetical protein
VRVVAVAHTTEQPDGLGALTALDVDDVATVQDGDLDGLLRDVAQLLDHGVGR